MGFLLASPVAGFPASVSLSSSFLGTAAQLGILVNLCSFKSLDLTLLFCCWSDVMFNTKFLKSHASIWIFSWEDQILVAICWFKSLALAGLVASSVREQRHGGEETSARARQFHSIQDALLHLLYFMFHL